MYRQLCKQIRRYSAGVKVSDEVRHAVESNIPVVALESTIITHGLPYPENIEMALSVEDIIRDNGAVPATIAFVHGVPTIGVDKKDLQLLGDDVNNVKISRRDIPNVISRKLTGGTTIAATMILANKAGIDVFSTGGLGGVSRPYSLMDVSADLDELSKTPVAVVCSGPKSILDIGRTIEYLETKGVPVSTYIDDYMKQNLDPSIIDRINELQKSNDTKKLNELNSVWESLKINVPGFYVRDSGFRSPYVWESPSIAANMIFNGKYGMEMENGYVFCAPAPVEVAMDKTFIDKIIDEAQDLAEKNGIYGKHLTPFMLKTLYEKTNGKSAEVNVAFVKNNAELGARISVELSNLKDGKTSTFQPINIVNKKQELKQMNVKDSASVVVGSAALDTTCKFDNTNIKAKDSNPGKITNKSVGGVGFNIALAATCSNPLRPVILITALNTGDIAGSTIVSKFAKSGMNIDGIINISSENTAQYISMHDQNGNLELACADMDIIEKMPNELVIGMINEHHPEYILMDANISIALMNQIINTFPNTNIIIEPTSGVKCAKLGKCNLPVFPNSPIELITPTVAELSTIYDSLKNNEKFEDIDGWFNILDSLGIRADFRERLVHASHKFPVIKKYLQNGVLQQSFQLLPYFRTQIIKDGKDGVLLVQITTEAAKVNQLLSKHNSNYADSRLTFSTFTIASDAGRHDLGVVIQHFPTPEVVPAEQIQSVTGAGDSLVGYLLGHITAGALDFKTDTQGQQSREALVMDSQRAALASLLTVEAVNEEMFGSRTC